MDVLKREKWWVWLLLTLITQTVSTCILGALLDVFDKNAWYAKPKNWLLGILLCFIPFVIMIYIFVMEITCSTAKKLEVAGDEFYNSPYIWIILLIIPIFGWILFLVLYIYLQIMIIVNLKRGTGEKYIK